MDHRWLQWPSQLALPPSSSSTFHTTQNSFARAVDRFMSWAFEGLLVCASARSLGGRFIVRLFGCCACGCARTSTLALLKSCARELALRQGVQIHSLVIKFGCDLWRVRPTLYMCLWLIRSFVELQMDKFDAVWWGAAQGRGCVIWDDRWICISQSNRRRSIEHSELQWWAFFPHVSFLAH